MYVWNIKSTKKSLCNAATSISDANSTRRIYAIQCLFQVKNQQRVSMQCNAHFKCKSNKQRSVAKWKWSESKNWAAWTKRKRRMAATNIYKRYKYIKKTYKYTNALRNVGQTYSNEIQVPGIFLSTSKIVWSVEKIPQKGRRRNFLIRFDGWRKK